MRKALGSNPSVSIFVTVQKKRLTFDGRRAELFCLRPAVATRVGATKRKSCFALFFFTLFNIATLSKCVMRRRQRTAVFLRAAAFYIIKRALDHVKNGLAQ